MLRSDLVGPLLYRRTQLGYSLLVYVRKVTNLLVEVGVHDNGVPVLSARYLFGSVGAYLVEFQIPANAPLGTDQSLAVVAFINGTTPVFGNSVFLPGVAP